MRALMLISKDAAGMRWPLRPSTGIMAGYLI